MSRLGRGRWVAAAVVAVMGTVVGSGTTSFGDTTANWTSTSGDWQTASSWSTNPDFPNNGTPSGVNYAATISNGSTVTVTDSSAVTVDSVVLSGNSDLTLGESAAFAGGTVTVDSGSTFAGAGNLTELSNTNVTLNGGTFGFDTSGDEFTLNNVSVSGSGTVSVTDLPDSTFENTVSLDNATLDLFFGQLSCPGTTNLNNMNLTTGMYATLAPGTNTTIGSTTTITGPWTYGTGVSGTFLLTNNGTIAGTNQTGDYDLIIDCPFVNNGLLKGGSVPIYIDTASFTNNGTFNLNGGTVNDSTGLTIGGGTITDGSVGGIINNATTLASGATLQTELTTLGARYIQVNATLTLEGDYEITLEPGALADINPSSTYEAVSCTMGPVLGSFLNVANGQRLETSDGSGSFVVNYGTGAYADGVYLTDFEAGTVPEPGSMCLLGISGAGLLIRRRRRV